VANLLVVIELVGDHVHPASLEVLGQARRIGSALGATVFALLPCAVAPGYREDDFIAVLSRGGADKVLLACSEGFAGPARWSTQGPLIASVCAQLPPTLLLLADTDAGRELGARAAARLGAALLADAWVEVDDGGLALFDGSGERARRLEGELDFPVVARVPSGRYLPAVGDDEVEVEMIAAPPPAQGEFEEVEESGASPERPSGAVVGACPEAEALAAVLGGTGAAAVRAQWVVAVLPATTPLDDALAWQRAPTRVALGAGAATCSGADFAVDGDGAALAAELTRSIPAPDRGAGG
jgi:electron transfer flavoprotein